VRLFGNLLIRNYLSKGIGLAGTILDQHNVNDGKA